MVIYSAETFNQPDPFPQRPSHSDQCPVPVCDTWFTIFSENKCKAVGTGMAAHKGGAPSLIHAADKEIPCEINICAPPPPQKWNVVVAFLTNC